MNYAISYSDPLWIIPMILLGIPLVLWIGFATTLARRDAVDRPNRIAQWYGYSVCLIAVIVLLISVGGMVNGLFTLANPLYREEGYEPTLSSFEAYRATYHRTPFVDRIERDSLRRTPPSEAELRPQYEALRADRIARSRVEAQRSLVSAGISGLLAVALFLFHWRWLRRMGDAPAGPSIPA